MNEYRVYEASRRENVAMARGPEGDVLLVDNQPRKLDLETAQFLRERFPYTAPVPVLKKERSFGVGDRLGLACPGHIRVFNKYDAIPVFAQQSVRELTLTKRSFQEVLDCVTFAVFKHNFQLGFGADGDHLKKAEDIAQALSLGYTMITLDCSEHIRGDGGQATLSDELKERYLNRDFDMGEGLVIRLSEQELASAQHTYGDALVFAKGIWDRFFKDGQAKADLEISIDETATPTTPQEHFFVASELKRLGVQMATMAPRFCGEFQKGIDYIGDLQQFDLEMAQHATIARHFGYKLSIHSGSDKFSAFPSVGKHTKGRFHVKTAGTNWLEAMRVVAMRDPKLYRGVHKYALTRFADAKKFYHVTTDLNRIPDVDALTDGQLESLFEQDDARQLIHITYGFILNEKNADGSYTFRDQLYSLWRRERDAYEKRIFHHIGRHVQLLRSEL